MSETLFDDATPTDDLGTESPFEALDTEEIDLTDTPSEWIDKPTPVRWMFEYDGRGKLIEYALKHIVTDDVIYHNKRNLGNNADTSRHSVHRYIDKLVEIGIYEQRTDGRTRYRANRDSTILAALAKANEVAWEHDTVEFEL